MSTLTVSDAIASAKAEIESQLKEIKSLQLKLRSSRRLLESLEESQKYAGKTLLDSAKDSK